jgi:nucleotide-binding universal stress UspA family protein
MSTPPSNLSCRNFGFAAERLLLPIDLKKCPLDVFPFANGFTKPFGGEVILLHVLEPTPHDGDLMLETARLHLERIARDFLRSSVEPRPRVRVGLAHEEIFAEATEARADLILLPVHAPSIWKRLAGSGYGSTARNIVGGAPCGVFVVDVQTRFNCLRRWSSEVSPGKRAA